MALVTLTSRLSNITRSNPTPEKKGVTPRATDFFSNEDGKCFTIRQSKNDTKLRITGFSQNPEFNEKNKFQEPVKPQESRLKIAWDKMKDDYYARGQKDNDRFGIRQNSTQPYIIREIGETWGNQSNGIDIIRGGASTYASRVSNDVKRLNKYLSDNPSYLLKQQLLFSWPLYSSAVPQKMVSKVRQALKEHKVRQEIQVLKVLMGHKVHREFKVHKV